MFFKVSSKMVPQNLLFVPIKYQIIKSLSFAGHMVPAAITHLSLHSVKADTGNM